MKRAIFVVLSAGCSPSLPPPQLETVEPNWGYNGEDTEIHFIGRDFYPSVEVSGETTYDVDRRFSAWIETEPPTLVSGMSQVDYSELEGRVPAGLEVGTYGVRVRTPAGAETVLEDAFTVTDSRADHLFAEVEEISWTVNQPVLIRLELQDPADVVVASPLEVIVQATGTEGDESVVFEADTLDDQVVIPSGIQGRLGSDGRGYLALTSTLPNDFWVHIRPADPDSVITEVSQFLTFTAGTVAGVRITLPEEDFSTTAGDEFPIQVELVDGWGNPAEGITAALYLLEGCPGGSLSEPIQFVDSAVVNVTVTGATGVDCADNRILAVGTVNGVAVDGNSPPFSVSPAAPDELQVSATPDLVVAGVEPVNVWVWAQDGFGNLTAEYEGTVQLLDDHGVLDPANDNGSPECGDFVSGLAFCEAVLWVGGGGVELVAQTDDALAGRSNPIEVLPGPADAVQVDVLVVSAIAGEDVPVDLQVLDAFDNAVPLSPTDLDNTLFTIDDDVPLTCTASEIEGEGLVYRFVCTFTLAQDDVRLKAAVEPHGVSGVSSLFDVIHGEIAEVAISIGATEVSAGDLLGVGFKGYDTFGNEIHVEIELDLEDETGTLSFCRNPAVRPMPMSPSRPRWTRIGSVPVWMR